MSFCLRELALDKGPRVGVTRALREAIKRIGIVDPQLGKHLARSVRTGNFCCYAPPDGSKWTVVP